MRDVAQSEARSRLSLFFASLRLGNTLSIPIHEAGCLVHDHPMISHILRSAEFAMTGMVALRLGRDFECDSANPKARGEPEAER